MGIDDGEEEGIMGGLNKTNDVRKKPYGSLLVSKLMSKCNFKRQ